MRINQLDSKRCKHTLHRDEQDLALTYGIEARRHYGDRAWAEVEPALAAGWPRLRDRSALEWIDVMEHVQAAWEYSVTPLDP